MTRPNYFTIAKSPHDSSETTLLFDRLTDDDINPSDFLNDIKGHQVFSKMMEFGLVIPPGHGRQTFELTTDFDAYLDPSDYTQSSDGKLFAILPDQILPVDMFDCYNQCGLPHKTILSCAECMRINDTVTNCTAKNLWRQWMAAREASSESLIDFTDPEELFQRLKNRKDRIGDCTYVSPSLTKPMERASWQDANPHFLTTIRDVDAHDFDAVAERSEIRSRAMKERGRKKRFQKEVCSTCLMQEECPNTIEWKQVGCVGPYNYPLDGAAAYDEVVREYAIPYNGRFLATYLFRFAGELPFKVDRKATHLSCRVPTGQKHLELGIVHDSEGVFYGLPDSELMDIVRRKREHQADMGIASEGLTFPELTNQELAVLLDLASRECTPPPDGYWHRTRYNAFFITTRSSVGPYRTLELTFRWTKNIEYELISRNSVTHKGIYRRHERGWEFPYTIKAKTLGDIFKHYADLRVLKKTPHELRRSVAWDLY